MLKRFAAALLLAATALPGMAADLPNHPFIHVSATADQYIMPDVGEIDIDIVSLEPDADAAWKIVNDRLEASRALFAQHGIAAEDVFVQDIVRRPRKVDILPEGQPMPMETRVSMHVTVRDLGQWTPVMRALIVMKDIESLAVTYNRSDREKIESDLLQQALVSAKLKAQEIARGVGARLGPATGVSIAPLKNLSNAMGMASDSNARGGGGRRVPPKTDMALVQAMRLAQTADVIYRIGGK
ncbi:SIMPL domain-containing protein [Massilia sp. IC2-477]|uniref:SIMPL domain-containing protein n=1 Tax=Massilia sp. IC2-477 TaxID=2887198 RepID=UPI001D0FC519|nr:SIMPL domain-containing protein [Massilia sp. IC2-477]MCC2957181.1 SIMPL domain-containing protein [Massilia sp. IC2-477]